MSESMNHQSTGAFFTPSRLQTPKPSDETTVNVPLDVRLMRWSTHVSLLGCALALLAAVGLWVITRAAFAVQHVQIKGDVAHQDSTAIYNQINSIVEGNFFSQNLHALRNSIEDLPWVRGASVHRVFPDTVLVRIEEHQAAALWGSGKTSARNADRLLNTQGEIFSLDSAETSALVNAQAQSLSPMPRLLGNDAASVQVLEVYQALKPLLTMHDFSVQELELSGQGLWRLHLSTGAKLELGRGNASALMARVNGFLNTWAEVAKRYGLKGSHALQSADLRYPNGYAIRLKHPDNQVAQLNRPTRPGMTTNFKA
jgi:cell division protein FtsQ